RLQAVTRATDVASYAPRGAGSSPSAPATRRDVLPPHRCARQRLSAVSVPARYRPGSPLDSVALISWGSAALFRRYAENLCSTTCGDARHQGIVMPLHSLRHALAAAFCLSPISLFAQTSVPQLDTVVVTASRSPQILQEAMGDVTVIGRE